jgi:hypothetical protein
MTAQEKIAIAQKHLRKVQAAWDVPTDWEDLYLYGFYCLEAAVEAASLSVRIELSTRHWKKVEAAAQLHTEYGLTDIQQLLLNLNVGRKAAAYGDVEEPELEAEDIAVAIEAYVKEVEAFVEEHNDEE